MTNTSSFHSHLYNEIDDLKAINADLLAALEKVTRLATDINSLNHADITIAPKVWSALFQECNAARVAIAKAQDK